MSAKIKIGFLGAGKMATALAKGFVNARLLSPEHLLASDPVAGARNAFAKEVGAKNYQNCHARLACTQQQRQ